MALFRAPTLKGRGAPCNSQPLLQLPDKIKKGAERGFICRLFRAAFYQAIFSP